MDEYNSTRENLNFSTSPFAVAQKGVLDTTTISLENVSQVDHDSGQFDEFNKDDNNNAIIAIVLPRIHLMANNIACHATKKKKVKELHQILTHLNIYDNKAKSVLLSALGDDEPDDSTAFD
eukprot:10990459-Ditylum_brightwellii.AAC.1